MSSRPVADPVLLLLVGILTVALRGEICFAFYPPTLLLLAGWAVGLAAGLAALTHLFERCERSLRARLRAVWLLPLALFLVAGGVMVLTLWLPHVLDAPQSLSRGLGLPPGRVVPLLLAAFVQNVAATLLMAVRAVRGYVVLGLVVGAPPEPDRWSGRLALVLGGLLVAMVWIIRTAEGGPLAHLRAYVALGLEGPESSLRLLGRLYQRVPDAQLADSCLFRMARLHQRDLSAPAAAERLYRRLQVLYPGSPWRDEARFGEARCLLAQGELDAAGALLAGFPAEFPDSPLAGEAGLLRAAILGRTGDHDEAHRVLRSLTRSRAVVFRPARYPFDIVPAATLAAEELAAMEPGGRSPDR